jgi:hypothetical protein
MCERIVFKIAGCGKIALYFFRCESIPNSPPNAGDFVDRQIVHDDDIATLERWTRHCFT